MNKVRSDAQWKQLSPEHVEALEKWLFEENLGYRDVVAKAEKELGIKTSYGGLRRFYEWRSQERSVEGLGELVKDVAEIKGEQVDTEALRLATMKIVAAQAFRQVRRAPDEPEKWGPAVRWMVANDRNERLREEREMRGELRAEDRKVRREALDFAREKFQFDMIERAVRALPELHRLKEAMEDPDPSRYSRNPHWNEARDVMFGVSEGAQNSEKEAQEGGDYVI
jgi:hypothetical protein